MYRNFHNQAEIDKEYNAISMVPDLNQYAEHDTNLSNQVRDELNHISGVKYGSKSTETIDIFPSEYEDSPVLIYIHGGYWCSMNSHDFHFVARGPVLKGITVVMPNYSLCPSVPISTITEQMRAVVSWVYHNIVQYNGNPERIFIAGHSAGAQQVGMLVSTNWKQNYNLPNNIIKGGIPISGIFDLTPLYYSWLQPTIFLDQYSISTQSPLLQIPDDGPPLLISVGENESNEFIRQSKDYHTEWTEKGLTSSLLIQPGKNHFTAIHELNDPNSLLLNAMIKFIQNCKRNIEK